MYHTIFMFFNSKLCSEEKSFFPKYEVSILQLQKEYMGNIETNPWLEQNTLIHLYIYSILIPVMKKIFFSF